MVQSIDEIIVLISIGLTFIFLLITSILNFIPRNEINDLYQQKRKLELASSLSQPCALYYNYFSQDSFIRDLENSFLEYLSFSDLGIGVNDWSLVDEDERNYIIDVMERNNKQYQYKEKFYAIKNGEEEGAGELRVGIFFLSALWILIPFLCFSAYLVTFFDLYPRQIPTKEMVRKKLNNHAAIFFMDKSSTELLLDQMLNIFLISVMPGYLLTLIYVFENITSQSNLVEITMISLNLYILIIGSMAAIFFVKAESGRIFGKRLLKVIGLFLLFYLFGISPLFVIINLIGLKSNILLIFLILYWILVILSFFSITSMIKRYIYGITGRFWQDLVRVFEKNTSKVPENIVIKMYLEESLGKQSIQLNKSVSYRFIRIYSLVQAFLFSIQTGLLKLFLDFLT